MSKDIQKTALRLPRALHSAIHESAAAAGRTMNAEIVHRLQKSFDDDKESVARSLPDGVILIDDEAHRTHSRFNYHEFDDHIKEIIEFVRSEMKKKEGNGG